MINRNPFFIILVTTLVVFLGYHYSKDKVVQNQKVTAKEPQNTASLEVKSNEATVKDWDRLFKKIINKMG